MCVLILVHFFVCSKLVTLFSTSVHNIGLKCIVFLTFCRVAKLALDKIRFKKSLYFPYYFTIFPILALYFWKIAPILSPIFLFKAISSPVTMFSKIQVVVYYQCCWLVELLLGYMLLPTSSEKRRIFGGKKGLKFCFKLFCLDIFDQLVGFY